MTEHRLDQVDRLRALADKMGRSLLDLAVGGLAGREAIGSVIPGATRPEQVRANVAAGMWTPTAEELALIDEITSPLDNP